MTIAVLAEILPPEVSVATADRDSPEVKLPPAELAAVADAAEGRRREFATGRACARDALRRLGVAPVAVGVGADGAPRWPAGIVGSITHCDGFRAAAVARDADFAALGIDAEPDAPLPDRVLGAIALPDERAQIAELALHEPGVSWDRLLFSVKESAYKAWSALTRRRIGFAAASVSIDQPAGTFAVRLPGPVLGGRAPDALSGRWLARDGLLLTAVAVSAGS